MPHPPAYPHAPIEEIAPELFMVRGCISMGPGMRITRNMAIVRHAGELTLVNPMRLEPEGERALRELGEVKRLLRLGPMHGVDDPYYIDTFRAELWTPGPSKEYPEPKPDVVYDTDTALPFPEAEVFRFEGTLQSECALLLQRGGGVLLTCDAIQHYGDYSHNSLLARLMMPWIGFPKTTLIGPIWLKRMTPEGGSLESEFRRLAGLDFDALLAAHGTFLGSGAREAIGIAIGRSFGS